MSDIRRIPEMLEMHLSELFRFLNDPALAGQEPGDFLDEAPDLTSLTRELLVARHLQHEAGSIRTRAMRCSAEVISNQLLKADICFVRDQLSITGIIGRFPETDFNHNPVATEVRTEFEGYLLAISKRIDDLSGQIAEISGGFKPNAGSLMQWFRENVIRVSTEDYGYGALFNEHAALDGSLREPQDTVRMAVLRDLMLGYQVMCRDQHYKAERGAASLG